MLPTDEHLPLPHFEDALLDRLHEEQQAGAYRRRRGQPPRRLLLVGAVAAATALIAGVALVQGGDDPPTGVGTGGPTEAGQADPELPGRVLAALDEALPSSLVHTSNVGLGVEVWSDPTSLAERRIAPTKPDRTMDWGRSVAPGLDDVWADEVPTRLIDHCMKQYSDKMNAALSLGDAAQGIRNVLDRDGYLADGSEMVDGRELLRLVPVPVTVEPVGPDSSEEEIQAHAAAQALAAEADANVVVYVDPATDLPVLWIDRQGNRETIEFLPRTAENMALLVPPVPPRYTKVPELAQDEVRAAGCV